MRIKLAYGTNGLWVDLPDRNVVVLAPEYASGVANPDEAMLAALRAPIGAAPLRELVRSDDQVAVVFSDITRAQPRERMLSVLLEEISVVPRQQITLINAVGTHRSNTDAELIEMLGRQIVDNYRIVQHNCWDYSSMVPVGKTRRGRQFYVNANYQRATFKILTGFIEPHFFAGFSGGPKSVCPGISDHETILANHDAVMIAHPNTTWAVIEGNPMWEEMRDIALATSPNFLFNVAINRDKEITGVFAGDLIQAYTAGAEFVKSVSAVPVPHEFDIVITTNSGYPLDINLYQAVKGMAAAARIVKPGGSIIVASECRDGVPEHGEYGELLGKASGPAEMLETIRSLPAVRQDQWQVQVQAQLQLKADVYVKSEYLSAEQVRRALLKVCTSIEDTVAQLLGRYGPDATICVLPEGPMTIPYVSGS